MHIHLRFLTFSALHTDNMTLIKTLRFHSCYTYLSQLYVALILLVILISVPKSEIQGWEHSLIWQECSQLKYINIYDIFTDCENTDCTSLGVSPQWDPIWSLWATPECHLPVTTLIRLLVLASLLQPQKEQNHSVLLLFQLHCVSGYRTHSKSPVLWEAHLRTALFFLILILMWHHFVAPLLRKKMSHIHFQIATEWTYD